MSEVRLKAEQRTEFGRLACLIGSTADHFLKGNHVGIETREHVGNAVDARAAVHAATLVDVVGGQPQVAGRRSAWRTVVCHDRPRRGTSSLRQPAA